NPFDVPVPEKIELFRAAVREAKKQQRVFSASAGAWFALQDKYFASTEGSSIQQLVIQTFAEHSCDARDLKKNLTRYRNFTLAGLEAGWEHVVKGDLVENARRIREEVLEHVAAPPVKAGEKDLVLLPTHLCLTIHASIGR